MQPLIILNHIMALALEIALLIFIGMWGYTLAPGPWMNWLGVLVVLAFAVGLWGWLAAPKSTMRLPMPWLLIFKLGMFAAGAGAAWAIGQPVWAVAFGVLSAVHLALAARLGQV